MELTIETVEVESFRYVFPNEPAIVWNITAAKAAVQAGEVVALVDVPPDMMREIAERNEWSQEKLDTVDPSIPGIGAPIIDNGQIIYVLIDGLHRNARALRDGQTFKAHLLTDDASRRCLVTAPSDRIPR